MNEMTTRDWKQLDALYEQRTANTINWGVGVSEHDDRQEDIAIRYGIDASEVSRLVNIGKQSANFMTSGHAFIANLPNSVRSMYQLISANEDGKRLTKTQIRQICKNGRPTRAFIKAFKQEVGLLPPPPSKKLATSSKGVLNEVARLVPASELDGLSNFGVTALEKQASKLEPILSELSQSLEKKVLRGLVGVFTYQQKLVDAEVNKQVKLKLAEREEKLAERERKLVQRESKLVNGIPVKDRKLIQSVLHPDKAPKGSEKRYATAFDAFRKFV